MMIANMAAGNIAIRFEAKGPCLPVTTACATSTNEVGEAFHAIRTGYADVILAGGAGSSHHSHRSGGLYQLYGSFSI